MATEIQRTVDTQPELYAPNPLFRWFYRRFFGHIHVDERWSGVVRSAAERGVVVYVMRTTSFLDFVCLDFLTKKLALPLVRFVNDLGMPVLEPFGEGERRLRLRRQIPEEDAIASVVRGGQSALLFLRRRPRMGLSAKRKPPAPEGDLIRSLVEIQLTQDRPILLVPQTFVWSMLPPTTTRGPLDLVFGPVEWPGRIRRFLQFVSNYRNALLRAGEPFDLKAFIDASPGLSADALADKVRYALVRRIERERALVLGPSKKTVGRLQEELLRSPRLRKHIESEARSSRKSVAKVERQAVDMLNRLAARQHPSVIRVLSRFLDWVWNRIYDGVEVDKVGLERVRAAARDGAVVYLPSHKSHVDYLVLSSVLYGNALLPPLIAAGENLSFFPLGPILRRGGAFFIRRSFRGQKLYSAIVDAYMRKLLVEGYGIEFFIEGGRSRTGKLLPPKYGLLSMVVDAALTLKTRKVYFAPISIGYERIIEERSYVHELSGREKQKENVSGLLKTSSVLRSKYGRLYMQFGDVIPFEDVVREVLGDAASPEGRRAAMTPRARRALVQRIAHQVTYRINEVTVVTPAALVASALLVHPRKGMTRTELHTAAADLLSTLRRAKARIAPTIEGDDGRPRPATLDEATALFVDARLIVTHENVHGEPVYTIPEERRLALEYYKNTVIHFFVDRGLIAAAMLVGGRRIIKESTLRRRVQELSRAFKFEFMFRADAEFDRIFDDTLSAMIQEGEIARSGEHVRPAETSEARMLSVYMTMLETYFEAYVLVLRGAALLLEEPLHRKEWLRRTLAMGQRMYLSGEIMRRESLTQHKLETGLKSLKDHQLVRFEANDMLDKGPKVATREDLKTYETKLSAFLKT